jgi:hypothetical protein
VTVVVADAAAAEATVAVVDAVTWGFAWAAPALAAANSEATAGTRCVVAWTPDDVVACVFRTVPMDACTGEDCGCDVTGAVAAGTSAVAGVGRGTAADSAAIGDVCAAATADEGVVGASNAAIGAAADVGDAAGCADSTPLAPADAAAAAAPAAADAEAAPMRVRSAARSSMVSTFVSPPPGPLAGEDATFISGTPVGMGGI